MTNESKTERRYEIPIEVASRGTVIVKAKSIAEAIANFNGLDWEGDVLDEVLVGWKIIGTPREIE